MSQRSTYAPHYRRLQETLKKQILEGVYQEGDLLPSEYELCALHGVARSTVRHALSELVKEGYIFKKKGKGSIVSAKRRSLGLLSFRGFSEVVNREDRKVKTIMLKQPYLGFWDVPFFYPLSDLEQAAGCISLKRLRYANEDPVMLEYTFVPNLNLPRFCSKPLVNGSLFDTLHIRYEVEVNRVDQDVKAIAADAKTASYLQIHQGAPILHIHRKYGTTRADLSIYSSLFCNTDKYAIGTTFS